MKKNFFLNIKIPPSEGKDHPLEFLTGFTYFIKPTPENPVLWTGMKGVSAESRKKTDAETSSA
jgi:hypothetical protein